MSFSVASYNVLASAYIHYSRYRRTSKMVLDPAWRIPALMQRVASLAADVICLQEVEMDTFAALKARLGALCYAAEYVRKPGKPDGCATFYREPGFELIEMRVLEYADGIQGEPSSGCIALFVFLRVDSRVVGIANTHLIWDPPESPSPARLGYRQALQLLDEWRGMVAFCDGWLICGDFNVTPESDIVALLENAGFRSAHAGLPHAYTCHANGQAKMIDYLFHSPTFRAEPRSVAPISDQTVLPSSEEPSDHLPIVARFFWNV